MIRQLEDGTYEGFCDFVKPNREFCDAKVYVSKEIINTYKFLGSLVHCDTCLMLQTRLKEYLAPLLNANKLI